MANEFNEIYVMDLGGDVRANPKLSGTKNNVFGIQTGVAISFFVKRRGQKGSKIFYARRPEFDTKEDKLSFLGSTRASDVTWQRVEPDKNANWINLTENDWDELIPVADKKTKAAKGRGQERAIFRLFSLGVVTSRDEWLYSPSDKQLHKQVAFYVDHFNKSLGTETANFEIKNAHHMIKWTRSLRQRWESGQAITAKELNFTTANYRPFTRRHFCFSRALAETVYQTPQIFGWGEKSTPSITVMGDSSGKPYFAFAINRIPDLNFVSPASGGTQTMPRYRYNPAGERIDNITDWALKEFQKAYGPFGTAAPRPAQDEDGRGTPATDGEGADSPTSPLRGGRAEGAGGGIGADAAEGTPTPDPSPQGGGGPGQSPATPPGGFAAELPGTPIATQSPRPSWPTIEPPARSEGRPRSPSRGRESRALGKDDIFHYVYAVLHDPVYREKYALNLKREFPRIPFYPDFWKWAAWGETLMALHIGYETVEPWPLLRTDTPDEKARAAGVSPKALLKADRDNGIIRLDTETTLSGIPAAAWDYRLGNRSGLDWILDQYREKTPKDPTIREKFNTYRFADYKEKVADLLARVTRVSVETVAITEAMKEARRQV